MKNKPSYKLMAKESVTTLGGGNHQQAQAGTGPLPVLLVRWSIPRFEGGLLPGPSWKTSITGKVWVRFFSPETRLSPSTVHGKIKPESRFIWMNPAVNW